MYTTEQIAAGTTDAWAFYELDGKRAGWLTINHALLRGSLLLQEHAESGRKISSTETCDFAVEGKVGRKTLQELVSLVRGSDFGAAPASLGDVIDFIDMMGLLNWQPATDLTPDQKVFLIQQEINGARRRNRYARLIGDVYGHETELGVFPTSEPRYKDAAYRLKVRGEKLPLHATLELTGTIRIAGGVYLLPKGASGAINGTFMIYAPRHGEHLVLVDTKRKTGVASNVDVAYQ